MGPIGMPELMVIFVIILVLFGAKKLPELAKGLGKSMNEFKKARDEFEHEITRAVSTPPADAKVKEAPGKESREDV